MKSGALDQRVTIQIYTKTRGTSGEQVDTWTDWKTIWASVTTSGGAENYYNPQLVALSSHRMLTRYIVKPGLEWPLCRLVWRGKILDVVHIDESRQRHGELYWLCREQVTP
jgi:SPP1 family predicted phage head-tail adaptor